MNYLKGLDFSVVQQCMHCGMCLPTCPTYTQTLNEKNSPRGRISLMRAIAEDRLEVTEEFGREMYYCLGCLACQTACPAGVNYAELFEMARGEVESRHLLDNPWRRFIRWSTIRVLFFDQRLMRLLGKAMYFYQASGLQGFLRKHGFMKLLPATFRNLEPLTPVFSKKNSAELIGNLETPATKKYRVAMLTGCVQDIAFSDINRDTVDVLIENHCEVWTPTLQGCCGSLHAHNGEIEYAREIARKNIDLFLFKGGRHIDAIISNAGGCGSHLKHYGHLLANDPDYAERAKKWDFLLKDAMEFLVEIGYRVPKPAEGEKLRLTYHESCHLTHGQKIVRQPREILKSLPAYEYVELTESSWCCGSAGIYNITQPESSAVLLERKMKHVENTGAQVVATSNPGCMIQIVSGLNQKGVSMRVAHPMTLLAEAYRAEKK